MMGKILILGGGFGGIRAALDLEKRLGDSASITLIDKNGYHAFTPSLYEVATADGVFGDSFNMRLRKTICIPHADIFKNKKINFIQGEVVRVDLERKTVYTRGEGEFNYDYLIIGLGSEPANFDIPGVADYAYQFKTIEHGLMINQRLESIFSDIKENRRGQGMRIVVAGGGFTGIEFAAEVAVSVRRMAREYGINQRAVQLTIIEASDRILPDISDGDRRIIIDRLTGLGVVVVAGTRVQEVDPDFIKLSNGQTLTSDLTAWTAGIRPNRFLKEIIGLALTEQGKIIVDEHLNTAADPTVFAVGDAVEFIDHRTKKSEPSLAYVAINHGKIVAENIIQSINKKEFKSHLPFTQVWVAPVGGKFAVAHLGSFGTFKGTLGWIIRGLVDLRYFMSILPWLNALRLFREDVEVFTKND
ncbi:MAG: NAD(P)/FAD-dependent oxidoreductase [Patescibacteria group bacterium]